MATEVTQKSPFVDNADVVSLQVSLPQLLDLALGTPEVGAVNFSILHNFLQVLLHQIDLQTTKVEYRGENAKRIKTMVASLKLGPSLRLQEDGITDDAGKIVQQTLEPDGTDVDVLAEVENDLKVTKAVKQQVSPKKDTEAKTVILVESVIDGSTPTALAFKQLEQSVKELQHQFQVLKDLSTTPEMMERLKRRMTDPVTDMWQFININKRLEASEQGIDKLTIMLQDVMKASADVATIADTPSFNERLNELENKVTKMEQEFGDIRAIVDMLVENKQAAKVHTTADGPIDITQEFEAAAEIAGTNEVTLPFHGKEETTEEVRTDATYDMTAVQEANADNEQIRHDIAASRTVQEQQELRDLDEEIAQIEAPTTITPVVARQPVNMENTDIIKRPEIDEIGDNMMLRLEDMKATHSNIIERLDKLEKEVDNLLDKVDSMQETEEPYYINELVTQIQEIQNNVKKLEDNMEKLEDNMDELLDDKDNREKHLNTLLEQIEFLKSIKADKEDLDDALIDKADVETVNKKVSYNQFDAVRDDLARGLVEAVDKLNKQESIWQQALDEVQNEIASKADKIEMMPLKDMVNTRLKVLQEKLKNMAEEKCKSEAAGTKKMLKDVQCISCDKDVVMKTDEVCGFPLEPPLHPTISMRPYLTYKLDQVRKQQRLPHCRNMIQLEAAMQETKRTKTVKEEAPAKTPRTHLSNRYCGGSHTVTTPQQRVLRTGHFLTQWGPAVVQLSEGLIRGKDGQMYRSRPAICKQDTCESVCWQSQINDETRYQTPQERVPSVTAMPRKSPTPQRNNVVSQKRDSRKPSKEPEITEPSTQPIEETQQVTSPEEIIDYSFIAPTGPQDEIIYETNAATK